MVRNHRSAISLPTWHGFTYPTYEQIESFAWDLGAVVVNGPIKHAVICWSAEDIVICMPDSLSPLERIWELTHEVAHLVLHRGYTSESARSRQEAQANRWAACALIPEERIRMHSNACEDAMIAALSAHYEDIPMVPCPQRELAHHIAVVRLNALKEFVA